MGRRAASAAGRRRPRPCARPRWGWSLPEQSASSPDARRSSAPLSILRRWVLPAIEVALGLGLVVFLATVGRTLVGGVLTAVLGAAVSFVSLLHVDGAATAWTLFLAVARIGLAVLPSVLLIRAAPRQRKVWLIPTLGAVALLSMPVSLTACPTIGRWLLLVVLSAVAIGLSRVPFLGVAVLLPYAVLFEVVPSHGLLDFADVGTRDPAYRDELLVACARNDGERPLNLTADQLMPYHGINALGDDLVFLAGEGPEDGGMRGKSGGRRVGSWWLRQTPQGLEFERPSEATGNLWRGCMIDDTIWMVRASYVVGVRRLPAGDGAHEQVTRIGVPTRDMDLLEAACDPAGQRVYVTEFFEGGVWEVPLGANATPRRHHIGGVLLIPEWRADGRLVLVDSSALMVFDPAADRIVERVPARLGGHGFDLCPATGQAAVADLTGRLRVFDLDEAQHYRFAWGVPVFAPRRVAYSADCSRIAVTSADDHRVYIVDAASRSVIDVFTAGPALREVAATGPRQFSVSDVCSITTFRW